MKHPHLSSRKSGKNTYFHFRVRVPLDLIPSFFGRKEFQISLKGVSNKETILVSALLQSLTKSFLRHKKWNEKTYFRRCKRNSEG
jgi:hypothetical protein